MSVVHRSYGIAYATLATLATLGVTLMGGCAAPAEDPPAPRHADAGVDARADARSVDSGVRDAGSPKQDAGGRPACVDEALTSCAQGGCHATGQVPPALTAQALEDGSLLASSRKCSDGRAYVDPGAPEQSLLLQVIDPERHAAQAVAQTCENLAIMPLGQPNGLSAEQVECVTSWIESLGEREPPEPGRDWAAEYDPVDAVAALSKSKLLLSGAAPTADEVAAVQADPDALRGLMRGWMEEPIFEEKMKTFFTIALQQDLRTSFDDALGRSHAIASNRLHDDLSSAFARTAWRIVDQGRPLHEILTTNAWDMNTALLVYLMYFEQTPEEAALTHTVEPGEARLPLETSAAERRWVFPEMPEDCTRRYGSRPDRPFDAFPMLTTLFGRLRCFGTSDWRMGELSLVQSSDHEDWRVVTLVEGRQPTAFYDLPSLRAANSVGVRTGRRGYFTTPAFLSNWLTNKDNQHRVTINQTLITSLGYTFTGGDATVPAHLDAVDEGARQDSYCMGCHKNMDPMRRYFAQPLRIDYMATGDASPPPRASFGLLGERSNASGFAGLADAIATHPRFARAWVQKMCVWANSQRCDSADPEFVRIERAFVDGGYDLRELLVELLSSPLVRGDLIDGQVPHTYTSRPFLVSVARQQHMCDALAQRLGRDVCALGAVVEVLDLLPADSFARGAIDAIQTVRPSAFQAKAHENLCARAYDSDRLASVRLASRDPDMLADFLTHDFMGLPLGHPREPTARAAIRAHIDQVTAAADADAANRSAFILACTSPDITAMGY